MYDEATQFIGDKLIFTDQFIPKWQVIIIIFEKSLKHSMYWFVFILKDYGH